MYPNTTPALEGFKLCHPGGSSTPMLRGSEHQNEKGKEWQPDSHDLYLAFALSQVGGHCCHYTSPWKTDEVVERPRWHLSPKQYPHNPPHCPTRKMTLSWQNPRPQTRDRASLDAARVDKGCDQVYGRRDARETSPLLSGFDPARERPRRPGDGGQTSAQERSGHPRIRPCVCISGYIYYMSLGVMLTVTSIQRTSPEC